MRDHALRAASLCVLLAGCSAELVTPREALIECTSDAECPEGFVCATTVNLCVSQATASEPEPALDGPVSITPDVGTIGTRFTVSFAVTKPLSSDPELTVDLGARQAPLTVDEAATDREGLRYTFFYDTDGSEARGTRPMTVSLVDRIGKSARGLAAGALVFDFAAPLVLSSALDDGFLTASEDGRLEVELSEEVDEATLTMRRVGGAAVAWALAESSGAQLVFTHAASAGLTEGAYALTLVAQDPAGNSSGELDLGEVVLDFTVPQLGAASITPPLARPGEVVRVRVELSEPPARTPSLVLRRDGEADIDVISAEVVGNVVTYLHEVALDGAGAWDAVLSDVEDAAGNAAAPVTLGAVTFDGDAPVLVDYAQNADLFQATGRIEVTFTADEPLGEDPVVLLQSTPLAKVSGSGAGPWVYELELAGTGLNGTLPVFVTLVDVAGNQATYSEGVASLDTLQPSIEAAVFSPSSARNDSTALLTITASELLQAQPVLTWQGGNDPGFTPATTSGLNYTWRRAISGGSPAEGTYTLVGVQLVDVAGNQRDAVVSVAFSVDPVSPSIIGGPTLDKVSGYYKEGDTLSVTFRASEALASGSPRVSLSTSTPRSATCALTGVLSNEYSCSFGTLSASIGDGAYGVVLELTDPAGNITVQSVPVTLDFTPPDVVATGSPVYGGGDPRVYTLSTTEPVSTPVLTVQLLGVTQASFFSLSSSTPTSYVYRNATSAADGTYTVTAQLTDRAGNVATVTAPGFTIDTTPPAFTMQPQFSPVDGLYRAGTTPTVIFQFANGEPLDANGPSVVMQTAPARDMPCTEVLPSRFSCALPSPLAGTEVSTLVPSGLPIQVAVEVRDPAGNARFASVTCVIDFNAPAVVAGSANLVLVPDANNWLNGVADVTAATVGTQVRLFFTADEPLSIAGNPVVSVAPNDVTFAHQSGNSSFVYSATIASPAISQGAHAVTIQLTDRAGNVASVSGGSFSVDTVAPARPSVDTTDAILLERAPWAAGQPVSVRSAAGAVEANSYAAIFDAPWVRQANGSPDDNTLELGYQRAGATGQFGVASPLRLSGDDLAAAFIAVIDAAGNISDDDGNAANGVQASLIRDVVWTATMGRKVPGRTLENPNEFYARRMFLESRTQQLGAIELGGQAGSSIITDDTSYQTDVSAGSWERLDVRTDPHRRIDAAMAYDAARGVVVMLGGEDFEAGEGCDEGSGDTCSYTWEWNGASWRKASPLDIEGDGEPPGSDESAMVFDSWRSVVVLFDGANSGRTWEYDGVSWAQVSFEPGCSATDPHSPSPCLRQDFAMAFDSGRGVTVLHGGGSNNLNLAYSDTWEWDGATWRRRTPTDPEADGVAPTRRGHKIVYDSLNRRTVLWGGSDGSTTPVDLWEWNGASWDAQAPGGGPIGRVHYGMAYDSRRNRVVVHGGQGAGNCDGSGTNNTSCRGTWELNPSTRAWSAMLCTGTTCLGNRPTGRYGEAMTYDQGRGRVVMFGGHAGTYYNGMAWVYTDCDGAASPVVQTCGTTSEWDGATWRPQGPSDPELDGTPARYQPGLAYDRLRDRVVMFGGTGQDNGVSCASNQCATTWTWNGASWLRAATTGPQARNQARMAYDEDSFLSYLFGGLAADGDCGEGAATASYCDNLWRWNGASWSDVTPVSGPTGRYGPAFAYNSDNDTFLLFGGFALGSYSQDTWELNPDTPAWTARATCSPTCPARPERRVDAALAYDRDRNVFVLFGGSSPDHPANTAGDTWEWNGSTWTEVCTTSPCSDSVPSPRWGASMWYDERLRRVVMHGGSNNNDTWLWSGSAWTQVDIVELTSDSSPAVGRIAAGTTYDTLRQRGFTFGGVSGGTSQVWTFASGTDTFVGHSMHAPFTSAGVDGAASIRRVEARFQAGGQSATTGGVVQSGVQLWVHDLGEWTPAGVNGDLHSAPNLVSATFTDPTALPRLFSTVDRTLSFAVTPLNRNGNGQAVLATDYAQVSVSYRWPGSCTYDTSPFGPTSAAGDDNRVAVAVGTQTLTGNTCACSHDVRPSCQAAGHSAPDVVYVLDTPTTGTWNLDARVSGFNSVLMLYQSQLYGSEVGCNDDATPPGSSGSRITATLATGTRYYLFVDGNGASCGDYSLSVTF